MNSRWLTAAGGALVVVALFWLGTRYGRQAVHQTDSGEKITIELLKDPTRVSSVTMRTLDGRMLSSADWRGKVTIVNFWATWCGPCRAEIPDLVALKEKYRDQVQIIGISEDEGPLEAVQRFANQYHINYPIVMKTEEIGKAFPGVYALPTSFVIDRDGLVVQKHVGLLNAVTMDRETRVLAGLVANASIEYVEDGTKKLIANAAQATTIPGVDLDKLTPTARAAARQKLNSENCTCGCGLTLAACRINDPTCSISLPLARKIVDAAL